MPNQIDELTDRVIRKLEPECVVCETILDDEAINEQDLASTAYDAGRRVQKLVNPKGFKEGTYKLAEHSSRTASEGGHACS